MTQPLWNDRLQMPYASVVEYRRAGGITDDVWADLMTDPDFSAFVGSAEITPTPDQGNSDPDALSPGLEWRKQQILSGVASQRSED